MSKNIEKREGMIKRKMFQNFGLKVKEPRDGGKGNSNCDNTSRRAFEDPGKLGTTLDLEFELIKSIFS
jgi:hypothetical protein